MGIKYSWLVVKISLKTYINLERRILGPCSMYSALVINIVLKVDREANIDPPIQVEYIRSGGAAIRIFVSFGDK